jgi:hypothetical protein
MVSRQQWPTPLHVHAHGSAASGGRAVSMPYAMLPVLLVVMILGTAGAGMLGWRYLENRMVGMVGESLSLLSAEVADKLDQFMFERQGDMHMIVRALIQQPPNIPYMTTSMQSLQQDSTLYHWLGVADTHGRIIASTDPASLGKDMSNCGFCQAQFWSLAFQWVWVLTIAFRSVRNLRMAAVIATFCAFPRASNRW